MTTQSIRPMPDGFFTTAEVAKRLGLTIMAVRGAVQRGSLKAKMVPYKKGKKRFGISKDEVARYRKENLRDKPKAKKPTKLRTPPKKKSSNRKPTTKKAAA